MITYAQFKEATLDDNHITICSDKGVAIACIHEDGYYVLYKRKYEKEVREMWPFVSERDRSYYYAPVMIPVNMTDEEIKKKRKADMIKLCKDFKSLFDKTGDRLYKVTDTMDKREKHNRKEIKRCKDLLELIINGKANPSTLYRVILSAGWDSSKVRINEYWEKNPTPENLFHKYAVAFIDQYQSDGWGSCL